MARHAQPAMKVLQSSIFLMGSTIMTAGLGFLFWGLVAHLYSTERVGLATSLISAISLISYLGLLGFNSTVIRFPARGAARNSQLTIALLITGGVSVLLGASYLGALPWFSPKLLFVRQDLWFAVAFLLFCACAGINLLTDSVFIAARIPQYNMLVDGIVQNLTKLAMPIFLVTLGSAGIVTATGVGYAVAVIASLLAMRWRLGFRFDVRTRGTRLREQARFSLASYVSALLNLAPLLLLPTLALQYLGAQDAAYYFMAFQIANMLNAASHAIGDAMFSEGSHDPARIKESLRRAAKLMLVVMVPAAAVVAPAGGLMLAVFGHDYAQNATGLLAVLAVGSLAVALNIWASCALKLMGRVRPMVASNIVFAAVTIGGAAVYGHHGLIWLGWAWTVGNLLSGLAALAYVPSTLAHAAAAKPADDAATEPADDAEVDPDATQVLTGLRWKGPLFDDSPTLPLYFPWNFSDGVRPRPADSRVASPSPAAPRVASPGASAPRAARPPLAAEPLSASQSSMAVRPRVRVPDRVPAGADADTDTRW